MRFNKELTADSVQKHTGKMWKNLLAAALRFVPVLHSTSCSTEFLFGGRSRNEAALKIGRLTFLFLEKNVLLSLYTNQWYHGMMVYIWRVQMTLNPTVRPAAEHTLMCADVTTVLHADGKLHRVWCVNVCLSVTCSNVWLWGRNCSGKNGHCFKGTVNLKKKSHLWDSPTSFNS